MLLFKLALRYTKAQLIKPSYCLALFSFSLAVSLLVVSLLVMSAYEKTFEKSIVRFFGQVQVLYSSPQVSSASVLTYLKDKNIKVLKATSFLHQEALIVKDGKAQGVLIEAHNFFEQESLFVTKTLLDNKNKYLNSNKYKAQLPVGLMKNLSLKLGDAFDVVIAKSNKQNFERKILHFYVSGVLDFGRTDYNRRYFLTSFSALKKPLNITENRLSGTRLWLKKKQLSKSVASDLQNHFAGLAEARHWRYWANNLLQAVSNQKKMIFLVLFIILIIAGFNVSSALFILIVQKTKELSLLRVAGLSSKAIYFIFSLQSFFTGLIALFFGFLLGYLWAYLFLAVQLRYFSSLSQIYKLNYLKLGIPINDMLSILVSVLLLVLLTAIIPIYKAGKNSLLEGLSYEF